MKSVALAVVVVVSACGSVSNDDKHDAAVTVDSRAIDAPPDTPVAFSPSQLGGLRLWLDAEKGVTSTSNKVSAWGDQSGQANNAVQTTAARQPQVVVSTINGHAVLRFDGADDVLKVLDSASLQLGMDDFTIAVVGSWSNQQASYGAFMTKQIEGTYPYLGYSVWANFPQPSSSTTFGFQIDAATDFLSTNATALNDGSPRLFVAQRKGMTMEIRVGGTTDKTFTTTAVQDVSASTYNMFIGGHEQGAGVSQNLQGDIAEFLIVRGALTANELQKLETFLKTKYAL
jgi:hypothetical protein